MHNANLRRIQIDPLVRRPGSNLLLVFASEASNALVHA